MKRTCAILPSYNEEKNIAGVIKGILRHNIDVIVIDDGSTDRTFKLAKEHNVVIINHSRKIGKGASIKDGLNYAVKNDYDYAIIIDADGQHNPDEIPLFIKEADANNEIGIVIGNRLLKPGKMPAVRFYTNKIMSSLISALCRQNIPDTQCGYKLITKNVLEVISIKSHRFEVESELLLNAARAGFKINSIPVMSIYAGEKSSINPFMDTLRFIKFLTKIIFK